MFTPCNAFGFLLHWGINLFNWGEDHLTGADLTGELSAMPAPLNASAITCHL